MTELRRMLASVPEVAPAEDLEAAIADSVAYLASEAAQRSIERDIYWPKWESPWWHMVVLWELGEARRIPQRAVEAMIAGLDALPVKIFPRGPEDVPGGDLLRDTTCHCALGTMYQVLTASGIDVDARLPWIKPWFVRYQMVDGGLTCDWEAYLVEGECPSSMVGTVAPFEAMLGGAWTAEQRRFVDRAAAFLIARELRLGSSTVHNAEEREVQASWLAPCFPRLYFYDVLRGLTALVRWAQRGGDAIPARAVSAVVAHLVAAFPDGVIRIGRQGFARCPTSLRPDGNGSWHRQPTQRFALLDQTSAIGAPSATLTREWTMTRRILDELLTADQIID